jgi:hypothetical protein
MLISLVVASVETHEFARGYRWHTSSNTGTNRSEYSDRYDTDDELDL